MEIGKKSVNFGSMRYVVIEDFNGLINLVVDPDDGMTKVFDNEADAVTEAQNCQNGTVVCLDD